MFIPYSYSVVESATAKIFRKAGDTWVLIRSLPIYYRWYFELEPLDPWTGVPIPGADYREKLWDQVVFVIDSNILKDVLRLSSGDNVWISGCAKFIIDGNEYSDVYGTTECSWVKYTYTPLKQIVDSWYNEYFGG